MPVCGQHQSVDRRIAGRALKVPAPPLVLPPSSHTYARKTQPRRSIHLPTELFREIHRAATSPSAGGFIVGISDVFSSFVGIVLA